MRYFLILSSLLLSIMGFYAMLDKGFRIDLMLISAFFLSCSIIFLLKDKIARYRLEKHEKKNSIIKNDHIFFPKGYYFKHGYLKNKKVLLFKEINEIRLNTFPISARVNDNEIIFLIGLNKEAIHSAKEKLKVPITSPQDNWSLLLDEFLDTEFTESEKNKTLDDLAKMGIDREEVEEIRKKLKFRMLARTWASLEWVYYGHYDVLGELFPLTKKKYWWTMEIALRE